jgi:benzoate transport
MNQDPRTLLAESDMTSRQVLVVLISLWLTALDGFDVLAISFAAPGIARDWGIDRAALGVVLSMELIGMGIGSIVIGGLADQLGRRYTILGCVTIMTVGMAMAASAHGVYDLSVWRVFTGLGIGGVLAASNAVAAEFSNLRRRDLSVSVMAIGYPLGAIGGGAVVAVLLNKHDWRIIFQFGAVMTALCVPIVFWGVPESVAWLCYRQPARALERVNRGLAQLGYPPVAALPPVPDRSGRTLSYAGIFRPGIATTTMLLSLTYFLHVMTFYFMLKWIPKIVVDMGFAPSAAARVLVWANVGGATGGAFLGLMSQRFAVKGLTVALLVVSTAMVVLFGHQHASLVGLSLVCALTGFCTNGGIVGIYAVLARAFPTDLRATGSGFTIGTGRGGAMLAPIVAGILFQAGYGLQAVALVMSGGSLLGAACLARVQLRGR